MPWAVVRNCVAVGIVRNVVSHRPQLKFRRGTLPPSRSYAKLVSMQVGTQRRRIHCCPSTGMAVCQASTFNASLPQFCLNLPTIRSVLLIFLYNFPKCCSNILRREFRLFDRRRVANVRRSVHLRHCVKMRLNANVSSCVRGSKGTHKRRKVERLQNLCATYRDLFQRLSLRF